MTTLASVVALLFGAGLFANALLFVPQAVAIWRTRSAKGVSLLTFGGFSLMQAIGVAHGLLSHDLALAVGMLASFLACGAVTVLAIIYRDTPSGTQ